MGPYFQISTKKPMRTSKAFFRLLGGTLLFMAGKQGVSPDLSLCADSRTALERFRTYSRKPDGSVTGSGMGLKRVWNGSGTVLTPTNRKGDPPRLPYAIFVESTIYVFWVSNTIFRSPCRRKIF